MGTIPEGPADNLNDLYLTLNPDPLIEKEELDRFYRGAVNTVRGEDRVARLCRKLKQSYEVVPFKTFVMGHPGVGKSTELSRLLDGAKHQQRGVRLSIASELNPASFKIFDVLLLMMIRITEETEKVAASRLKTAMSEQMHARIQEWFSKWSKKRKALRLVLRVQDASLHEFRVPSTGGHELGGMRKFTVRGPAPLAYRRCKEGLL